MKLTRKHAVKLVELLSHSLVAGLGKQKPGEMYIEATVCCALGLPHGENTAVMEYFSFRPLKKKSKTCGEKHQPRSRRATGGQTSRFS